MKKLLNSRTISILVACLVSLPIQLSAATVASTDEFKALPGISNQTFLSSQRASIEGKRLALDSVLLVVGKAPSSYLFSGITRSDWSHIALGVYNVDEQKERFLLESAIYQKQFWDGISPQVQINPLEIVYTDPETGRVLEKKIIRKDGKNNPIIVTDFIKKHLGTPYEQSSMELLKAAFGLNKIPNLQSLFCSELVALAFQELGAFPSIPVASDYTPKSFAENASTLPWNKGITLSEGVVISDPVVPRSTMKGNVVWAGQYLCQYALQLLTGLTSVKVDYKKLSKYVFWEK